MRRRREWRIGETGNAGRIGRDQFGFARVPGRQHLWIGRLGQLGYIRAIQLKLDEIGHEHPEHADFVAQMRALIDRFDLDQYMANLKTLHSYDH